MNTLDSNGRNEIRGPRSRRRLIPAAAAMLALLPLAADAQKPMVILEDVLETTTELVALPGSPGGSITARECRDCPSHRVQFANATKYYIGNEPVSYARFRQTAALGSVRLYVYFTPETRVLTRLRINPASSQQ